MTPKKFFHRAGHAGHGVGLELGEIDYGVGLQQPGGAGEALHRAALREGDLPHGVVGVQARARGLDCVHARAGVNAAHPGRREGAAGAVPHRHGRPALREQAAELRHEYGVRRRRRLRLHARDEVGLHGYLHARLHPAEAAQRLQRGQQRRARRLRRVIRAGNDRDINAHYGYPHGFLYIIT